MNELHTGEPPMNLQDASVDVQETANALVARFLRAKKQGKNYEAIQLRQGIEDLIKRENLDSASVYGIFAPIDGPNDGPEAMDSAEQFLR